MWNHSEMLCGRCERSTDCVSLECLDGSVLSQFTDMNTHVCATRGKCVVALPVHIQSWSWGEQEHHKHLITHVNWLKAPENKDTSLYLNGRGTVVWLLLCERPIWWLSGETSAQLGGRSHCSVVNYDTFKWLPGYMATWLQFHGNKADKKLTLQ